MHVNVYACYWLATGVEGATTLWVVSPGSIRKAAEWESGSKPVWRVLCPPLPHPCCSGLSSCPDFSESDLPREFSTCKPNKPSPKLPVFYHSNRDAKQERFQSWPMGMKFKTQSAVSVNSAACTCKQTSCSLWAAGHCTGRKSDKE